MIFLFYIVCVVLYFFIPDFASYGVSHDNLYGAFTYHFFHGSLLHLIINILALALIYRPIYNIFSTRFNIYREIWFFLPVYLCSVLAGLFSARVEPTVGASGMIYTLLGMLIMLRPTLKQLKNYIYVAIAFLISLYFDNSNNMLHATAFVFGAVYIICLIAHDKLRIRDNK